MMNPEHGNENPLKTAFWFLFHFAKNEGTCEFFCNIFSSKSEIVIYERMSLLLSLSLLEKVLLVDNALSS